MRMAVAERLDEQTLLRRSRLERGAELAAGADRRARIDAEIALLLLVAVTAVAILGERRADLRLEEACSLVFRRLPTNSRQCEESGDQRRQEEGKRLHCHLRRDERR